MSKNATQRHEHKRITSILICCLALLAGHFSRNLLNIELPVRYMRRSNRLMRSMQ